VLLCAVQAAGATAGAKYAGGWTDVPEADDHFLRPSRVFDLFGQSAPVPELSITEKRRVSTLFVLPASTLFASAGTSRSRGRSAVHLATWLLTHADPDGAVVLTAHHELGYDVLLQAMKEHEQTNVSVSVWANIMIAPLSFSPSRKYHVPDVPYAPVWSHLAGVDAAEERYAPQQIVFFDHSDFEAMQFLSFPGVDVHGCARLPYGRTTIEAPPGVITDGPAFLRDFHASRWRYWFVDRPGEVEPTAGLHAVAANWTVAELFKHRLGGSVNASFAPYAVPSARSVCPARSYDTIMVMLGGGWDTVATDQILTPVIRNPNAFVVVVAANRFIELKMWVERWVPPWFRANVHLAQALPVGHAYIRATRKWRPVNACAELEEIDPVAVAINEQEPCFGAMLRSAFRYDFVSGGLVPVVRTKTITLLPLRSAIAPFGGASQRFGDFSTWQTVITVPDHFHTVVGVVGVDAALDLVTLGVLAADKNDPNGLRTIGHAVFTQAAGDGEPHRRDHINSWIFDVRGRHASYDGQYPQWKGHQWPGHDVRRILEQARGERALVLFPIETNRGIGAAMWRHELRRQRLDVVAARGLAADAKSRLWCDSESLHGCAMFAANSIRWHWACEKRDQPSAEHAAIKCADPASDPRVRSQDVRPTRLRKEFKSLVPKTDNTTEWERDSPLRGRRRVDVLLSVITEGTEAEDPVEIVESWLEYCDTCVLAIEVGPAGNPGVLYDTLEVGLDPEVFDRVIVNPKRGMQGLARVPVLHRHLVNIKYARCFVAPLRVMMVAVDEAPCRPGLGEYLLRHSTNSLLDAAQLVAETRTDEYTWIETHFLGPGPRFIAAAQHLLYLQIQPPVQPALLTTREGHPAPAPPEEVHNAAHYCTGKALARQAPVMLTGPLSFEGTWYTGRQWRKVSSAFKLGYWLHDAEPLEYTLLHSPMAEDEIRRLYLPDTAWNITSSTKPPGRNTCYNPSPPRLHVPAMSAAKVKDALESMSAVQFSIKGVAPTLDDAARSYLAEKRRRDVGKQAGAKRQAATRKPAATEPDS